MDRVALLAEGKALYCGPSSGLVPYFATSGFLCPENVTPYDFIIDIIAVDYRTRASSSLCRARLTQLAARWALHRRLDSSHHKKSSPQTMQNRTPARDTAVHASNGTPYNSQANDFNGSIILSPHASESRIPSVGCAYSFFLWVGMVWNDLCIQDPCLRTREIIIRWSPLSWLRSLYLLLCRNIKQKLRNWISIFIELSIVVVLSSLVVVVVAISLSSLDNNSEIAASPLDHHLTASRFFRDVRGKAAGMFLLVFIQVTTYHIYLSLSSECRSLLGLIIYFSKLADNRIFITVVYMPTDGGLASGPRGEGHGVRRSSQSLLLLLGVLFGQDHH